MSFTPIELPQASPVPTENWTAAQVTAIRFLVADQAHQDAMEQVLYDVRNTNYRLAMEAFGSRLEILGNRYNSDVRELTKHVTTLLAEQARLTQEVSTLRSQMMGTLVAKQDQLKQDVTNLREQVTDKLAAKQAQLEHDVASLHGQAPPTLDFMRMKVPEPPTFQGTTNKGDLTDWLNQISLFCSASHISDDKQKIIVALTRLRGSAAKYMQSYFNKNSAGQDLRTFEKFVDSLN